MARWTVRLKSACALNSRGFRTVTGCPSRCVGSRTWAATRSYAPSSSATISTSSQVKAKRLAQTRRASPSTPRMSTSTPTTGAYPGRPRNAGENSKPKGMVPCSAGFGSCGLFGGHPADDRGQLLGTRHLWRQSIFLGRSGVVQGFAALGTHVECAWPTVGLFDDHSGHRGAAWYFRGAQHAQKRLLGQLLLGGDVAALAGAVERGRHHLADLWPRRYWLTGLYPR